MTLRSRVKFAKCQMLVTSFFVLLLGLAVASAAALAHFGDHFAVISRAPLERNPFEALDRWAFAVGIGLAGLLSLGAVLSAAATVREAQGLMAGGFLCFALVFVALAQVAFWRLRNPAQVEDAVLDTYDLVYDRAVRSPPGAQCRQLAAIQDAFLCCGKTSPFGLLGSREAKLCQGPEAAREDCLRSIRNVLRAHGAIASTLTSAGLVLTVYAMLLSAFLWLAIHNGCGLGHKGSYALSPRTFWHRLEIPSGRLYNLGSL
ncbi:tetraspanin-32 isoform X2 [Perognathus longimembris pacificus]|uniref:tetraspanin-32 isoform X2 n=1 Tax=Perognathus longimembris pacificus TaxID=214514 RepID=UPI0020190B85|nr:tetraspanin-32 isoform X2 [Perognathus longimembris pacificus]